MTKAELIERIANEAEISKTAASKALDVFINSVSSALNEKDGKLALVGFGTFSKSRREARVGRNPKTGEALQIPAKTIVKFTPGKNLKESV